MYIVYIVYTGALGLWGSGAVGGEGEKERKWEEKEREKREKERTTRKREEKDRTTREKERQRREKCQKERSGGSRRLPGRPKVPNLGLQGAFGAVWRRFGEHFGWILEVFWEVFLLLLRAGIENDRDRRGSSRLEWEALLRGRKVRKNHRKSV